MTQERTASAIESDINLLVSLGWVRDTTPQDEKDMFYQKNGKTAIVFRTTNEEQFEDKGIFKRCDFTAEGMPVEKEFINPLPY